MEIYNVRGKVYKVFDTQKISEKFSKREIVLEVRTTNERGSFTDYIKMQAVLDKCADLDDVNKGDEVAVHWKLAGRKWKNKEDVEQFFINVELTDISIVSKADGTGSEDSIEDQYPGMEGPVDDDPFKAKENNAIINPDEEEVNDLPF